MWVCVYMVFCFFPTKIQYNRPKTMKKPVSVVLMGVKVIHNGQFLIHNGQFLILDSSCHMMHYALKKNNTLHITYYIKVGIKFNSGGGER